MPSSALQTSADRKSTRLNSSHTIISYAVFCFKKKRRIRGVVELVVGDRVLRLAEYLRGSRFPRVGDHRFAPRPAPVHDFGTRGEVFLKDGGPPKPPPFPRHGLLPC